MSQSAPEMPMKTEVNHGSNCLSNTSLLFANQKTVSTASDFGINNAQNHPDTNKLPIEDSSGFTGTLRSSRQTLSSYGVEHRSPYSSPNSSQKDKNAAQHSPLLRQPPIAVTLIEGLGSTIGNEPESNCIHWPAERHSTVGLSVKNRPITHPNSSVGDTKNDAFSFINDEKRFDGDEIHSQRASSVVERHAELSESLPSTEGQQSPDSFQDCFSLLSETRDTDFIRLDSIEIQDTEPLDLSSLDVVNQKSPNRNKESTREVTDCPVSDVSHDQSQKWQSTGTSFDEATSMNQNSDIDEDETFLKIPVTSSSLQVESTDVENSSERTTTHMPAEEWQSVGSSQIFFSAQNKSQGVLNENNLSLRFPRLFSNEFEEDVINPEIPTNDGVYSEISTDTDNLSVEQSSEESITDNMVGSSSIHHEVFSLRKPGFMARSLHMQSTDELPPIEQLKSLTSTQQQFDSCSVTYYSVQSKNNLCNQVGDSIQSLPSRISCSKDSLNPNERDSIQCSDGLNEDTSINGSSSMTHDLYLNDLQTLWMKFEIFLRILYLRSTCVEQNFEESANQFEEDAQQCIIRVLRDSFTQSKTRNENCSLIEEGNSHQSLKANVVGQSSKCENVANTFPSHSNEVDVSLMDKHSDDDEKVGGTAKDTSISSYSQSQKVDLDDDALLPIDTNMSPGSPHLQLTDNERHSEDFLNHSAQEIYQCNDSIKNQLTQSLTQNDSELRISKDSSLQSLDEDLRDQNSWLKNVTNSESLIKNLDAATTESVLDTCDTDLVKRSNESIKDTSIDSYSQSQESDFDDDALLPIDTNMSPGSPYLQLNYDERHPEVFMKYSAPEIHQCNDSSKHYLTQSMTQNACELRILTDDSLQSLGADLREQSPCWKSVTISKTLNQHIDTGNPGICSDSQSQELDNKNDALLLMDPYVNLGSEHLQLTNVERRPYGPQYSAKKYDEPGVQRCKDISQKSSPKRKNTMIQEFPHVGENSARSTKNKKTTNSDNSKVTSDAYLQEDKSFGRCPEIHSDEETTFSMGVEMNSRSEHLLLTNLERRPYSPPYSSKKYDEPEVKKCKDISQKSFPRQKNSDKMIQESPHVGENSASSTKNKTTNSDNKKDTNDADLPEGLKTDKSIGRCPEITEEFHSDKDATLPMEIEVNSRSEHLQSTNIQRHPYSHPYSAKKYAEPELQRCKDISQNSFPRQKNSDTMIQESPYVGENSASSTKCKKNENSDNPKDTNDADLHEDKSIGRCPEITEEFHSDEDATLPMEFDVNSRCRQSTQNMTQNACDTIKESIFLRSKEADIRCRSSLMEIKLSSESPTINNDITNQGMMRAKTGTASKENTNNSTMKVAENSVSLTKNKEIRIPESLGNKPDEKTSYEPTTDTCSNRHSHMSQEFDSNEDAVVPTESEIKTRLQHLQLIDLERQFEISTNHLEAEIQHCNDRFHNFFPTENETHHIRNNCLLVDSRSFENHVGATLRRGTFSEDAAELDVNEFPNGSATDHISMHGDVVTIYGSASLSESSYWLGEQHYEVRLSETVRPIDEHNSLMWDDSMEDDDAPMFRHHLANSEDTMDSTDTLPSIRQLLSISGVQLRTSFIGVNSFQRDSNPTRHVSLSYEEYQNESIPYEMDESFVDISGSESLSGPFNGTGERCFQVRFSKTVRPITNRNS